MLFFPFFFPLTCSVSRSFFLLEEGSNSRSFGDHAQTPGVCFVQHTKGSGFQGLGSERSAGTSVLLPPASPRVETKQSSTQSKPLRIHPIKPCKPHTYVYIFLYIYIYMCVCVCMCLYTHTHIYIYIYIYMCVCARVCVCVCACIDVYIQIFADICI